MRNRDFTSLELTNEIVVRETDFDELVVNEVCLHEVLKMIPLH